METSTFLQKVCYALQIDHSSIFFPFSLFLLTHVHTHTPRFVTALTVLSPSELIDTYFILIHKKPLILLHWYHHISVLAYCWHSYVTKAPAGIVFCVMNYAVHAIMYFYYFLMAVKRKPKWFNSM